MRRTAVTILAVAALGATAGGAVAAPTRNGHNCAGSSVSQLAGPGFGAFVSTFAHQQLVDNFELANCALPPRNNP